ncbi:MAG: type II secretion system F family protein [Candidatus Paceibacterota bacterium]
MKFSFKAKNMGGEELSAEREAADRFTLARELRNEGWVLLVAEDISKVKKTWKDKISFGSVFVGRINLKDKIQFVNNLGAMVGAGLPLSRALAAISRQTKKKSLKTMLESVGARIGQGDSLSKALGQFPETFPEIFTAMISMAEESGKLPETLKTLGDQLSKTYDLKRKIKGAMIYPAVIVTAIIIVGVLMLIFLIPTLAATFTEMNVELPISTRIVIGVSNLLANHYLVFIISLLFLVAGGLSFARTKIGSRMIDKVTMKLPMVGELDKKYNSATIMRTISSLVSAGVSLVESLAITKKVAGNVFYQEFLALATEKIQKGVSLSSIFNEREDLFPVFVGEMTMVGEETGKLPEMLLRGAVFYEEDVDQATKNLSTIIEPVLMILIGIAVGFFAVSMLGPMYSLSSAIK